ncbi:MAG: sigma-54-dependent transcriptional regulator [Isosphaeraceae bacterium]
MRILIVDDEPNIRQTLKVALEAMGHATAEATDIASALRQVDQTDIDAMLVDLRLGTESGMDLMTQVLRDRPDIAVVIITAHGSIDLAVDAMRRGAFDFLPKPFTPAQVRAVLERVGRIRGLHNRVADLEEQVRSEVPEVVLDSPDPQFATILDQARRVATTDTVVLIKGESGTGKGVLARRIHGWSKRSAGPFITVSCPSLSRELLESEMFGHVKGAFTGAVRDTSGKVAAAAGGTLFLDEVADLPLSLQPKLLRFLQERRYERVGETRTRTADVRLIAATNKELDAEVAAGRFRDDLLYRLNVVEFTLPPLRKRADLGDLASHLLSFFGRQTGRKIERFSPAAQAAVLKYAWPGNLRELRNAIERAVLFAAGREIEPVDLPERIRLAPVGEGVADAASLRPGGPVTLEQLEAEHIRRVLDNTETREEAARILGIDPSTLYRKRKQLGL